MLISANSARRSSPIFWKCELSGDHELFILWLESMLLLFLWLNLNCFGWLNFRNDGEVDCYSVLIRLDSQKSADTFFRHFDGRRFSSLEVRLNLLGVCS